ncbi:hypothetical protein GCM10010270_68630 [Streptomyces violaceus]|nr:hypothetical protein GCM10010270_68630 [Streptomyces janthinus]
MDPGTEMGARMVVAHSLGSVVVYDMLSRGEAPYVTMLVTCGSPLGWPPARAYHRRRRDARPAPAPGKVAGIDRLSCRLRSHQSQAYSIRKGVNARVS